MTYLHATALGHETIQTNNNCKCVEGIAGAHIEPSNATQYNATRKATMNMHYTAMKYNTQQQNTIQYNALQHNLPYVATAPRAIGNKPREMQAKPVMGCEENT